MKAIGIAIISETLAASSTSPKGYATEILAADAAIFDLGTLKFVEGEDGPTVEHVPAWENMFDPIDGRRGKTIRVQRFVADKDALINEFCAPPEDGETETAEERADRLYLADQIRDSSPNGLAAPDHTMTEQHCTGYELYRLPVGRSKGRHVVVVGRGCIPTITAVAARATRSANATASRIPVRGSHAHGPLDARRPNGTDCGVVQAMASARSTAPAGAASAPMVNHWSRIRSSS